jgi:hypothetical protein
MTSVTVDAVDFDKLASSVQSEIACILCYAITGASHNAYVLARGNATGRFDIRGAHTGKQLI